MTILLTLYLAGMPFSLGVLLWALGGLASEDMEEVFSPAGFVAVMLWVVLWPVFLAVTLFDVMQER